MSDLISREEVLRAIITAGEVEPDLGYTHLHKVIENLPSAEHKKGRWIFAKYFVWECSECGKNPTRGMGYVQGKSELFRYCPCCGAKMEVEE